MTITKYIKSHAGAVIAIALIAIIIMVIAGRVASRENVAESDVNVKQVSLVDVSTFRDDLSTVSVDGVIESVSQADVKSSVSAPITREYLKVGDSVSAGQTIVEFQNADIRAQLEQARANLALAKGQFTSGDVSIDAARKAAIDKIRDAYTKTDDVVNAQIGQFLYNGNPNNNQLQSFVTDPTLGNNLNIGWGAVQDSLRQWNMSISSLTDSSPQADVDAAIVVSQKSLSVASNFLTTLSDALNNATKSASQSNAALISGWKTVASNARASVNASISALTTSGSSLVSNQAQISAAEAGVKNLEAQLAKTVISSPISGKIAALPLRTGEFATVGQLITTVVGPGGLQVKAYASSEDLDRITKGAPALIQGTASGTVTAVAPSVNQLNKKVEVTIVISPDQKTDLVVGQSVQAKITAPKNPAVQSASAARAAFYILPIQNVKIIPGAAYVYTLDADSKVVKNPVTLGEVKGDFVEIKSGITEGMKIVSPVYELDEGQVVKL